MLHRLVIAFLTALPLIVLPASAQAGATTGSASAGSASASAPPDAGLHATIRRTEYGYPHIEARNWEGIGYGFGYAFAQDDLCTMAEDFVTVDAQRSMYFGPTADYQERGAGVTVNNLDSDLFFQQVIDAHTVEHLLDVSSGPGALAPGMRQDVKGYVAGYNRYLAQVGGSSGVPDARCRGKAWVRPITIIEVFRRAYQLGLLASEDVGIQGIASAQPPSSAAASAPATAKPAAEAPTLTPSSSAPASQSGPAAPAAGSNAIAIGSAGTRDHTHGLLLGNPHFPWVGPDRFYEAQLTIPGKLDVTGAMLFGLPLVLIGHTMNMAWSHTVDTAYHFTLYQLKLVPGDPTSYLVDGKAVKMGHRSVTVQALQPDGSLKAVSRTLYTTRDGPVLNTLEGTNLSWTATTAFAMRDANADNFRYINHYFHTDMAQSTAQELDILKHYEGLPWVNTIVSDRSGHALYADIGSIPHVTDAEAKSCDTPIGQLSFAALGLPILDGSRTACDWGTDPDSAVPGIFGPSHLPYLLRSDYVTNSNDSYWLANPHQPLTGFARIIGTEGTPRSLRTRIGLIGTQARVDGTDGLGPPGFTLTDMENLDLSDLSYSGQLTRHGLVGLCRQLQSSGGTAPTSSGKPVPLGDACQVLAGWDLHANLDSTGELLFRRFWSHASGSANLWTHPFTLADPVHTPYGLNTSDPTVQKALGDAIVDLDGSHIPLGATVGSQQQVPSPSGPIPIHGGPGDPNGILNAIYAPFIQGKGFAPPDDGSSFIQVVTWTNQRCPVGANILTYSLSDNPSSPHHFDQTRLFSHKGWVHDRFCMADILSSPALQTTVLNGASITHPGLRQCTAADVRVEVLPGDVSVSLDRSDVSVQGNALKLQINPDDVTVHIPASQVSFAPGCNAQGRSVAPIDPDDIHLHLTSSDFRYSSGTLLIEPQPADVTVRVSPDDVSS